ncbi:terminase gpA endonuclease subunit [Bradyrhizobium sp. USDA 329]|uniref:terminase gpA endonuclease subunit n=1 Tax=unclassified Bradyrhizobium TaxID=2631580 RepID=UPI0035183119
MWDQLAELISTPIDCVPIHLTFVDNGFRPGKADTLPLNRVYEFCRRFPKRVRPTKGSSAQMRVPLLLSKIEVNRSGKAAKFGLDLVRLYTDHWKCWVHERLRWPPETPGSWHVPVGIDDGYCHQIVSEARIKSPTRRPEWGRRSKHNHSRLRSDAGCDQLPHEHAAGWLAARARGPRQDEREPTAAQ